MTIAVSGRIWFVNSAAGVNGDGRLSTPFNILTGAGSADSVDAANDVIFLYSSGTNYTGGITLNSAEKIIGQGASQSILTITGFTMPSGANLLPATGGSNPTITTGAANAVQLGTNNEIWGVTFGNTTGAGIAGTSFGTLKVRDTAKTGNGQALNLSTGALDAIFQSISTTSSASTGMTINAATGSFSVSGATSVTNSAGNGVNLTNNSGTMSFAALNITNTTTNTSGLVASENSGTITTTSGAINTGSGTAVNISRTSSTTPLNISLTSVSSSGGANDGISLVNTSGSFTVNGDGVNTTLGGNGSGGTIANKSGANGSTTAGIGVYLNNAANITLRRMAINGTNQNFGIRGSTVTGFILQYATVNGTNGNNGASDEDSVRFDNLLGSATIDNCNIGGGFEDNIRVINNTGTLNRINITNSTIGQNNAVNGNDAVGIEASSGGATVKVTIDNCTFTGAHGDMADLTCQTGTNMSVIFTNNQCNNTQTPIESGGGGIIFQGNGTMILNVSTNTVTGAKGRAISISKGATAGVFNGTINGNTVGTSGVADSGSSESSGIFVDGGGAGSMTASVTNNQVFQTNEVGIYFVANNQGIGSNNGTLHATVTGNTVSEPGAFQFAGLFCDIGTGVSGDATFACLDIGGAGALQNDFSTGDPFDFGDIFISQNSTTLTRLPGLGGTTDDAAVTAYLQGRNANSATTSVGLSTIGAGYTDGAACTAPNLTGLRRTEEFAITRKGPKSDQPENAEDQDLDLRVPRGEAPKDDEVQQLKREELDWMVRAALDRWQLTGASGEDMARLQGVTFDLADLPPDQVAYADKGHVRIDLNAAGYGWFFDQTPSEDSEFDVPVPEWERQTTEISRANGKMDLLTVIMRELGKVYLEGKKRIPENLRPLMEPTLSPSVRRMPAFNAPERSTSLLRVPGASVSAGTVAAAPSTQPKTESPASLLDLRPAVFNPSADLMPGNYERSAKRMSYAPGARGTAASIAAPFSGETINKALGTIPPGESVTIMFQVTIDSPFPAGVCAVTNVGHVTGTNFSQVDTNSDVVTVVAPVAIGSCPPNIMTNTSPGVCTAVVTYATPTATGCPAATVTCDPASGFAFPKGVTTVTCTATNGNPPDATCSFTVTVVDNQPPTIGACPANIITDENPPGSGSATVAYATPGSTDNCPGQTVICSPASGSSFAVGTTTVTCTATDTSNNTASCQFTVTVNSVGLTALSPAKVWIGLKNSDDVGTKFDLLAEVLKNGSVVGSGQLNDVPGGSSGFNNAVLRTITLALGSSVGIGAGDTLAFRLSVRIAATSGHTSGTARLWYNGAAIDSGPGRDAGSRFGATIAGSTSDYFLRTSFVLNTTAGSSRTFVDKLVSNSGGNPWVSFGTWSETF